MAWLLDTIRATVFAPDIKALSLPNWETLAGARRLQMTTPAPGMQLEIGLYRGYRLSLWEGPGRADLIAAAPFDTLPMTPPASLGDLPQFSTEFLELTKRWLSNNTS